MTDTQEEPTGKVRWLRHKSYGDHQSQQSWKTLQQQ